MITISAPFLILLVGNPSSKIKCAPCASSTINILLCLCTTSAIALISDTTPSSVGLTIKTPFAAGYYSKARSIVIALISPNISSSTKYFGLMYIGETPANTNALHTL